MNRRTLLTWLFLTCILLGAGAQGVPFYHNISAATYKAHNQNFDIEFDNDGILYVANFEGLLYYDNSKWNLLYTPALTRVTVLLKDSKGKVWAGGYNFFGYVKAGKNGILELKSQDEQHEIKGEVQDIWESHGDIYFAVSNGKTYTAKQNKVYQTADVLPIPYDYTPVINNATVNWREDIGNGMTAVATESEGLVIINSSGNILYQLKEENGLCSDNIASLAYNKHGLLWGATDNGLFVVQVPSPYSHFSQDQGLRGEVLSLAKINEQIYAGTSNGLFRRDRHSFVHIEKVNYACWQLINYEGGLLAATSNGVYKIAANGAVNHLTTSSTMSILADGNGFYTGELDGVFYHVAGRTPVKVCEAERVTKFMKDKKGVIWMQNLYGRIWNNESGTFVMKEDRSVKDEISTLVMYQNEPTIVTASATKPFPYPLFSYTDSEGILWLTNNKGKSLYALTNGSMNNIWNKIVYPLTDNNIRTILHDGDQIWLGSANGAIVADISRNDPTKTTPEVFIRSIIINDDSIAWGGFGELPTHMDFKDDERTIAIRYAVAYPSLLLRSQYRYRINGGKWSSWDYDTYTEYNNQPYGKYVFEVQSRDAFGQTSEIVSFSYEIELPFYLRWYMIVLYAILFIMLAYVTVQWRIRKLRKDKIQLENIVQERTAEVVKQKDEIEEKSKKLETALTELSETQHELVRQEKMATVGKLTQGLIDRILNPLNYINNFSKLSQGLVDDVKANIDDEKENMDPENYDDTIDVLSMLKGNLEKVSEHGANTTRTLKAMEEMLKDRSTGIVKMDLIPLIRKDEEMVGTYYHDKINEYHIKIGFTYPSTQIFINANPELLSTTFMSLLNNAVYAVIKKSKRQQGSPEVSLTVTIEDSQVMIKILDNGIGIEEKIINKIFDPFFTTKTTGEASGVGLYLSREIIQNYGGDITVRSVKNEYTEFTILLPIIKN